MRIVVLGGAGKMGCIAVQTLAGDERVKEVVLADMNMEGAEIVADYINSPKIEIMQVDVNDEEGFLKVLDGANACLNATVYYTNLHDFDLGAVDIIRNNLCTLHIHISKDNLFCSWHP